jgi:ferredoxin--NADP+ reductase
MSEALRVAIVGSGPAGLYAAAELLKRHPAAHVELFDRLPTPGGLVRSGVSPDHAARRNVSYAYERLLVSSGRFRFHGHVELGRDLTHADLLAHHHAVIYASGAASDRRLDIDGEDLPGSHAATDFVGWYNGHPDHTDHVFDFSAERAVVIGNGNVALDVARMLLMPVEHLRRTDIADHALEPLANSRVREVVILGRRGPAQASFTFPELLELDALDDVDVVVETPAQMLTAHEGAHHPQRLQLLAEYAARAPRGRPRRLVLRFLSSPTEITGDGRVQALRVVRNTLVRSESGDAHAQATDRFDTLSCGLVFRSVGYRAQALPDLPFDVARGVLPNDKGRVIDANSGTPLAGTYVAGWLKRGPSGVIGSNKQCSQETVSALLEDAASGRLPQPSGTDEAFDALLDARQPQRVDYHGWKQIDRLERRRGGDQGRPRAKLSRRQELLAAAQ